MPSVSRRNIVSGLTSAISRNRRSLSRRRCSERWRWMALPNRLATFWTNVTSSAVKVDWPVECVPRTPQGSSVLPMTMLMPLTTLWSSNSGGPLKRSSVARSSTTTASSVLSVKPACESSPAPTAAVPTSPSCQPTPARNRRSERSGRYSSTFEYSVPSVSETSSTASSNSVCSPLPERACFPSAASAGCCSIRASSPTSARRCATRFSIRFASSV
ncbi:hypothetical protein SAMN05443574_10262 [Haloarcula vallismortis]|uniref:Uncharacterized protein n=1 Tax=Haloarcula vallismortis TaxID=28442 RepID=A0A1H2RTZ6_HALVA|nr:hypothetical protein SAMN05443574_10262 [Haloarcula vallismortis]